MSFARPARCLFCSFSRAASTTVPRVPRRQFHAYPALFQDGHQPPKPPAPPAAPAAPNGNKNNSSNTENTENDNDDPDPDPSDPNARDIHDLSREIQPHNFKPYTPEQKARLAEEYTPEQIAAIEAAESSIDVRDMADQFGIRRDPFKFDYVDDFSVIEPGVDKHVRHPESNSDFNAPLKNEDDFTADFARFLRDLPENGSMADWLRFLETTQLTRGKPESEYQQNSALVPDLLAPGESMYNPGEVKPLSEVQEAQDKSQDAEAMTDALRRLMLDTGFSQEYIRRLYSKVLVRHSVVNQTRLGKMRRMYVLAVAGNENGLLGLGEAKSEEAADAIPQAINRAMRNMQPILRYENRTIFGDVAGKVGATELKLMNRAPGFGIRCQQLIFEMCRAAGIHDLAARVTRSRNPMNIVKATYEALMSQRNPEDIARARGKKMVDVRKVYYSGRVIS